MGLPSIDGDKLCWPSDFQNGTLPAFQIRPNLPCEIEALRFIIMGYCRQIILAENDLALRCSKIGRPELLSLCK